MPYNRPGLMYYCNADATVNHGAPYEIAGVVGVAVKQKALPWSQGLTGQATIITGEAMAMITKGVVQIPVVGGDVKGDKLYITTANAVTKTAGTNLAFGTTVELPNVRGTPTGFIRVDLDKKPFSIS